MTHKNENAGRDGVPEPTRADALAVLRALGACSYSHRPPTGDLRWACGPDDLCGHPTKTLPSAVSGWLDLVHEADRLRVELHFDHLGSGPDAPAIEYRVRRPDGTFDQVFDRAAGNASAFEPGAAEARVVREITVRHRGDEACEAMQDLLLRTLDAMSDGFMILDRQWRYRYVNPRCAEILRRPVDGLVGQCMWDLYPDAYDLPFSRACRDAMETGQPATVENFYPAMGVWFENRILPVADSLHVYFRDVTARKRIEAENERAVVAMRELDSRLQLAMEVGEFGYWSFDIATRRGELSPEYRRLLGDPDEPLDHFDQWLERVHPEDRAGILQTEERLLALPAGERADVEYRILHRDGGYRWFVARARVLARPESPPPTLFGIVRDVTAERRDQVERVRTEHRLQDVLAGIRDGFIVLDAQWRYSYLNDRACELLQRNRNELQGRVLWDVFPQARSLPFHAACHRVRDSGREERIDQYFAATQTWYRNHLHPTAEGGIVIFLEDISELKRNQAHIDMEQERWAAAFDQATVGFVIVDANGLRSRVNPRMCELAGRPAHELVGSPVWDVTHPDDAGIEKSLCADLHAGRVRSIAYEKRIVRPDGSVAWAKISSTLVQPGGAREKFELRVLVDITERKLAETALLEERARLAATFEQSAVGVSESTVDERILRVNKRFCEIVRRTEAQMLAMSPPELTHPDDRQRRRALMDELLSGKLKHFSDERRMLRPDGSEVWVSVNTSRVEPGDGRPPYFSSMIVDISELKDTERLLKDSHDRLARFTEQITRAMEQDRVRIAREIHDELGQAFSGLKMDVAWLRRHLHPGGALEIEPLDERLGAMADFIDTTVGTVRRIATELRPAALDTLGLAAAFRGYAQQFQARTGIRCEVDAEDVALDDDRATALFRIFQEALTNVAKHAKATVVRIRLELAGDRVRMTASDDGRGFDPGTLRTPRTLGVLGITERAGLLGGVAQIASRPGQGTVVTVVVPVRAESGQDPAPAA